MATGDSSAAEAAKAVSALLALSSNDQAASTLPHQTLTLS